MRAAIPLPGRRAQQRSHRLAALIKQQINHQGHIHFEQYMQMCLYTEQLGYYESGSPVFGVQGDFTTSPERSHFFALAFARHIKNIQKTLGAFSIIEVGAGSGKFANDLIQALSHHQVRPLHYYIVETSQTLTARQQNYLHTALNNSSVKISWLKEFIPPLENALVIANEVLDALPVRTFSVIDNRIYERCVTVDQDRLAFVTVNAGARLRQAAARRLAHVDFEQLDQPYHSEINLRLAGFIKQIACSVKRGLCFCIDYGYPRHEYYLPERSMGTLICHCRHVANDGPLDWPGLQDISCNVDFTALAEAAARAGLRLNAYCTQAHFLLKSNFLAGMPAHKLTLAEQSEIRQLIMPAAMGERFQVMIFTKGIGLGSAQFTTRNLSHRL